MAHQVEFVLPRRTLGKENVRFSVSQDGTKLGELLVSRGAVVWYPGNAKLGYKLGWTRFDGVMRVEGRHGRFT